MLESAVIAFREGMEAFLIVAIMLTYLIRTERGTLASAVYAGVLVAVFLSAVLGIYLESISGSPMIEGLMTMGAGLLVGTLTVHMIQASKTLKKSIIDRLETHVQKPGWLAHLGIFGFTVLMVTREGMETALMMNGAITQSDVSSVIVGAIIGLVAAVGLAVLWIKKSHLVNLPLFLQSSALFLILFSIYLFVYGLHELGETPEFSILHGFHDATEDALEGGILSNFISFGLVGVPLGWLGYAALSEKIVKEPK